MDAMVGDTEARAADARDPRRAWAPPGGSTGGRVIGRLGAAAIAAVAICLAGLGGPLHVSASGQPRPITIDIHKHIGATTTGTFVASGAVTDGGTVTNSDYDPNYAAYPMNEVLHITAVLHGAAGDLTVQMEIRVTQSGQPGVEDENGSWQLIAATGAYAGLQGEGDESAVVDHNTQQVSRTLTGEVH